MVSFAGSKASLTILMKELFFFSWHFVPIPAVFAMNDVTEVNFILVVLKKFFVSILSSQVSRVQHVRILE